jgi:hypothetical protein
MVSVGTKIMLEKCLRKIMLLSYFFTAFVHLLKAACVTVKDILNLLSWFLYQVLND